MIKVFFPNGDVSRFNVFTNSTSSKLRALLGAMYPNAILSLFGCTYKADKYLESYFKNLDSSEMRAETLIILSVIKCPGDAPQKIIQYLKQCSENCYPAVLIVFDNDPGLYNCWNHSIHISPTEFVGNANPDDIRYPNHDRECIGTLETSDASIVATPLYFSYEYSTYSETAKKPSEIAFLDAPAIPVFRDLFRIQEGVLRPNNIFHCMPVWRKTLHDVAGYFNEYRYGTYADWALWLSALSKNIHAAFHQQVLGIYLVEPNSHNRIYPDLNQFAGNIISDYILRSLPEQVQKEVIPSTKSGAIGNPVLDVMCDRNIFGEHRSDFNLFANDVRDFIRDASSVGISKATTDTRIVLIPFIEKYFGWGTDPGEARSTCPSPIKVPWIGIIHVPFDYPCCIEPIVSPKLILGSELYLASESHLKALIFLSDHMESRYHQIYPYRGVPTYSMRFYTSHCHSFSMFDFEEYRAFPRVCHIGDWLRCFKSFFELDVSMPKIFVKKSSTDGYIDQLSYGYYKDSEWQHRPRGLFSVVSKVSDQEYDDMLASSVVFVNLLDTSANNLVTECIDRATPLVINRLPAAIEYLGLEYPLFYDNLLEAEEILMDMDRIRMGHRYLLKHRLEADLKGHNLRIARDLADRLLHVLSLQG